MRSGTLRGLVQKHVTECGGNLRSGYEAAANELDGLMIGETPKVKPSDFSIKALFEELVDPHRRFDVTTDAQLIAEAISASAFPQISNRIFHRTVMPEYEVQTGIASMLVQEDQATKTQSEEIAGLTAMEGLEMRPEQMSYEETDFGEKRVRIYSADHGRITSLTREAIFDDRTGQILRTARGVGRKAGQHRAKQIIQTIEMLPRTAMKESATRAFVYKGTAITQAQFYSTDHSAILDSQVNSNTVTDALGTVGLINATVLLDSMVDERGDEVVITVQTLLVPSALRVTAWQLTRAPQQFDTANRASNFFGPGGSPEGQFKVLVSPFLSSTTKYYLGDFQEQLLWLWVWKPSTATQGTETTKAFESQIIQRFRFNYNGGLGHTDYRRIIRGGA